MIETPAAVLIADHLAEVSAFFSVGTNDLTQYTLAVDRGNARLADRFTPHHPADRAAARSRWSRSARAAGIPVSVCGEMASEPLSAVLLIGLGYDRLSVSPPALPLVKWVVRTRAGRRPPGRRRRPRSARRQRGRGLGRAARGGRASTSTCACSTRSSALPGQGPGR